MFEQLFNSPFLYSLSLTLLHFLWQGLLMAFILKSLLFIIDKNKSKLRYALATFTMLANAILAVLTFTMVYPDTSSGINSNLSPIPLTSLVNELTQQNALFTYQELLPSILAYSLPYLSLFWLATIAILACKLLIEIRNVNVLPMHSSVAPTSALSARFDELAKQIKLAKTPKLLISLKAEVPMAIGWLKPVVLLPATMVTGLNSAQLEMLILHELAHIRRHDYLVNFLQTLIELLFFFHPSVHWIGKQIRNEREYCSDDIAVQHCGDAIAYAHTLTDTASLCAKNHFRTIPTMAMAASGGDLKARVLRLVGHHHCAPTNNASKWLAALSLLLALTLLSINQILTMPFSQQLNNQYPWQEDNYLNKSIINTTVTAMPLDKTSIDRVTTTLKNDSIAQQLLSRKETLPQNTLVLLEKNEPLPNLTIENKIVLTSAIVESLAFTNNQNILSAELESPSQRQFAIINNKEKLVRVKHKKSPTSLTVQQVSKSSEIVLLKPVKSEEINIKKDFQSKVKEQTLVITQPKPQVTLPSIQTAQFKTETAEFKSYQEVNKQFLVIKNKGFDSKENPYRQLSYSQEINKLAMKNDLYQASHTIRTATSQPIKVNEVQQPQQAALPVPITLEAKLLNSISPIYPSLAKRRGIEMEVKVNFTIDKDGRVKNINFAQQSKLIYFKSAIRSAIRKWRFSPAIKNNNKVESKMTKIFSFSLHA